MGWQPWCGSEGLGGRPGSRANGPGSGRLDGVDMPENTQTEGETNTPTAAPPDIAAMRADAAQMIGEDVQLPRWETVQQSNALYYRHLLQLIPAVEYLIIRLPKDDVPAAVARAGVGEAKRRMGEIEAVGLVGEVERVQRLARSVIALCDHYENLGGPR